MGARGGRYARMRNRRMCVCYCDRAQRLRFAELRRNSRRRNAFRGMANARRSYPADRQHDVRVCRRSRSRRIGYTVMALSDIITFGCRLNAYESEVIRARALEAGLSNAVVINTCAVTKEALQQSKQAVRKYKRANPGAKIIVTGCAAQTEPHTFAGMADVDFVLGNVEKLNRASYEDFGAGTTERIKVNDIFSIKETAAQFVD